MTSKDRRASDPLAGERAIRRLLGHVAKRRRPVPPQASMPIATETDPNREFAKADEPTAVWFFVFLPIFMLLFATCRKIGAS